MSKRIERHEAEAHALAGIVPPTHNAMLPIDTIPGEQEASSPTKKRRLSPGIPLMATTGAMPIAAIPLPSTGAAPVGDETNSTPSDQPPPPVKKSRTNTPWTPAEEQRLKNMRDAGNSWAEIAKTFPARTEGSVKKHWYKDMHYAEFAEDESQALLNAIKEYEANKWKAIGAKVGKPAKACEQYAKEHFAGRV